ncbi:MAG TPA: nitroreductase family deazaflavin-dependent oxidoreductase [Solirubrobacteraceae bacterium]|nr:nitroreductase family deazaflavin-dependent oxidoreductase [Solirubrobacteraceae bacterium]
MHLSPMRRRLLRAPAYLYDLHAGWILGQRFLRLTHTGRRSGRRYQTMLEVIGKDRATGELIVVAGLGRSAQWYRNVQAGKAMEIAIGHRRFRPRCRELASEEASAALADYEGRNRWVAPVVRRVLSRLVGWEYDGSAPARLRLVSELPMIGFVPE